MTVGDPAYANSEKLAFTRDDDGVLVLRFHANGHVILTSRTHQDFPGRIR